MPVFLKITLRELRSGLKGFYIALACLLVSSFTLTASQSFTAALLAQLQAEGRTILGGDVELRRVHVPFSSAEKKFLQGEAQAGQVSFISRMRVMTSSQGRFAPAQLKAVDETYPLLGQVQVQTNPQVGPQVGAPVGVQKLLRVKNKIYGAVVAPALLPALGIKRGTLFKIGEATFQLRGLIEKEPDGLADGLAFSPKIIVSQEALAATELVQFGSLISYRARLVLRHQGARAQGQSPQGASSQGASSQGRDFEARLKQAFPRSGLQVKTFRDSSPGLRRFVERVSMFLTLAALTTFLVSGIGIANAVSTWFAARRSSIATLKCLGAQTQTIFSAYLIQILLMAMAALVAGAALGAAAPFVLLEALESFLPLPVAPIFSLEAVGVALLYGLLVTGLFSLLPLLVARATPPSHLFRASVVPLGWQFLYRLPWQGWLSLAVLASLLFFIALGLAAERSLAIYFLAGAAGSLLLLYGAGLGLVELLRLWKVKNYTLRLALNNITRPASQSKSTLMALGLGLALLSAIALVEGNLNYQIGQGLPLRAPSVFVADIPNEQRNEVEQFLNERAEVSEVRIVPLLRAPLLKINDQPLSVYRARAREDVAWVLRGDRGLTYARVKPAQTILTQGKWWGKDYQGAPLLSMSENIALGLGLKIGDKVTINLFGRAVDSTIYNLRKVDWAQGGMNFAFIFSPKPFNEIPVNYFSTFRVEPSVQIKAVRLALVQKFPTLVVIETGEALNLIAGLMEQISLAARAASFWTLLAGILVLAASQAASFQQKLAESVVFKVLGAPRGLIARLGLVEYLLLGLAAAASGLLIGTTAAWAVITFLWRAEFIFLPLIAFGTLAVALLLVLACGVGANHRILAQKPAPFLRAMAAG